MERSSEKFQIPEKGLGFAADESRLGLSKVPIESRRSKPLRMNLLGPCEACVAVLENFAIAPAAHGIACYFSDLGLREMRMKMLASETLYPDLLVSVRKGN